MIQDDKYEPVISTEAPIEVNSLDGYVNRPLYDRLFSKIEPGSVRGSIFTLSIMCLGSGLLALPKKVKYMSISVAFIDIVLAGCAAYWTLTLMIITSNKYDIYEYSKLAQKLYGKWLAILIDITMLIYVFGIMILYQVLSNIVLI
jgi:amino acid permease